ncbi:helix-turn-helix domain-containing protein [Rathayibacter sp. KR2-224]|uniref:helix-turn-helix domain-containing protein n=1 Tax=Rathayibacter sp. KR2-224 TaxID=3400913 RepID=UPI003C0FAC9F
MNPCRGRQQLTAAEREDISRGIATGLSCRAIAAVLGRSPSKPRTKYSGTPCCDNRQNPPILHRAFSAGLSTMRYVR